MADYRHRKGLKNGAWWSCAFSNGAILSFGWRSVFCGYRLRLAKAKKPLFEFMIMGQNVEKFRLSILYEFDCTNGKKIVHVSLFSRCHPLRSAPS